MAGQWVYADRVVDVRGQVFEMSVRERRDTVAATTSFTGAAKTAMLRPEIVTIDEAPTCLPTLSKVPPKAKRCTGNSESTGFTQQPAALLLALCARCQESPEQDVCLLDCRPDTVPEYLFRRDFPASAFA